MHILNLQREIAFAEKMIKEPLPQSKKIYYEYYIKGMRRQYFGATFVSDREDEKILSWKSSPLKDEVSAYRGYINGKDAVTGSKRGRKRKDGVIVFNLKIPTKIYDKLVKISEKENVSLREIRKRAYEKFCDSYVL